MPEKEINQKNKMRRKLHPAEKDLWNHVTQDVNPLAGTTPGRAEENDQTPLNPEEKRPKLKKTSAIKPEQVTWTGEIKGVIASPSKDYEKSSRQMGRNQKIKWQNGEMGFDARLDLHGLHQDAAHRRLIDFIQANYQAGRRSLLVITGKGRGIIRAGVVDWLSAPDIAPKILGLTAAKPKDGGDGAFYILLRSAPRKKPV